MTKPGKTHKTQGSPPKYLNEYFNHMAGPFPTCTTRRRTRQPSDLRRPDLKVGGQFHSPTCRPLASGENGFGPVQGRVAGAGVVRSPLPDTAFAPKVVRGTRLPPSSLPPSLLRHANVILTSPYLRPPPRPVALHAALPPHQPATVSCHPGSHLSTTSPPYYGPTMASC